MFCTPLDDQHCFPHLRTINTVLYTPRRSTLLSAPRDDQHYFPHLKTINITFHTSRRSTLFSTPQDDQHCFPHLKTINTVFYTSRRSTLFSTPQDDQHRFLHLRTINSAFNHTLKTVFIRVKTKSPGQKTSMSSLIQQRLIGTSTEIHKLIYLQEIVLPFIYNLFISFKEGKFFLSHSCFQTIFSWN